MVANALCFLGVAGVCVACALTWLPLGLLAASLALVAVGVRLHLGPLFRVGDAVRCGKHPATMQIEAIHGQVFGCVWIDNGELRKAAFIRAELRRAS